MSKQKWYGAVAREFHEQTLARVHADLSAARAAVEAVTAERDALTKQLGGANIMFRAVERECRDIYLERDAAVARAERYRLGVTDFVESFEEDFVMDGGVVDHPEQCWGQLPRLYRDLKAALASRPPQDETSTDLQRDRMWCKALIATLPIEQIERVTAMFNSLRAAPPQDQGAKDAT